MPDRPELAEVYAAHVGDVYAFFAYRFGTRAEAEDLTQLTFERALKAWKRFDPSRASPKTWLLAIASNLAIDHLRADKSRLTTSMDDDESSYLPPAQAGPDEALAGLDPVLATAIGRLGERERVILALRFGGDLTGPEIAETLDLTLANVQQILSRALRKLRQTLSPSS